MSVRILVGDARDMLETLPSGSVQCAVSSPPYFGLRSYLPDGHPDKHLEIGAEQTPNAYVSMLVTVFREMRRVLADDGVFWLNIGDSYAAGGAKTLGRNDAGRNLTGGGGNKLGSGNPGRQGVHLRSHGLKPKDLLMIPARVALSLQADGWYLRSHCIWHKPNPMPESVRDRPTSAHESVFLLTKNARYFYDAEAVREPAVMTPQRRLVPAGYGRKAVPGREDNNGSMSLRDAPERESNTRNMRNVWKISPKPLKAAHFATFPPELAARCIKAGSRPGDTILDPFFGAGTTALAAPDRDCIGIDINAAYADIAGARLTAAGLSVTIENPHQPAAELEAAE